MTLKSNLKLMERVKTVKTTVYDIKTKFYIDIYHKIWFEIADFIKHIESSFNL